MNQLEHQPKTRHPIRVLTERAPSERHTHPMRPDWSGASTVSMLVISPTSTDHPHLLGPSGNGVMDHFAFALVALCQCAEGRMHGAGNAMIDECRSLSVILNVKEMPSKSGRNVAEW